MEARARKPQKPTQTHKEEGIVLQFDENLGIGILRLRNGQRIRFTHRQIVGEGFKILFEGERVLWDGTQVIPFRFMDPEGVDSGESGT